MSTTNTKAGKIESGVVYNISFACDTPGPETEYGAFLGYWNGEIDIWGKLTFVPTDGQREHYLFSREIEIANRDA